MDVNIRHGFSTRRVRRRILAVAEFARIQTARDCLNSGEFSYAEDCQELLSHPTRTRTWTRAVNPDVRRDSL